MLPTGCELVPRLARSTHNPGKGAAQSGGATASLAQLPSSSKAQPNASRPGMYVRAGMRVMSSVARSCLLSRVLTGLRSTQQPKCCGFERFRRCIDVSHCTLPFKHYSHPLIAHRFCLNPDLQVEELPTAQMYALQHARQQQQQPGSRAHVVEHLPSNPGQTEQQSAIDTQADPNPPTGPGCWIGD